MPDLSAQLLDGESEAERILDDEFADFAFQIDEYQLQARMSRLRSQIRRLIETPRWTSHIGLSALNREIANPGHCPCTR